MIVISRALVLAGTITNPDNPVIGYHNIVTTANIVADTTATGYPASNLANPATHEKWKANDTTEQYLTITTGYSDDLNYVGIAGHNFYSAQIPISIEGFISSVWTEIVGDFIPPDDGPIILVFADQVLPDIRIRMQSGDEAASVAVVCCGLLLTMEKGIYDNHTPIKYGRKTEVTNGRAESGAFTGRIVTGESNASSAAFMLLDPDWWRENMPAFLDAAQEVPFFFAWRPDSYPYETGYAWLTNDPIPVPTPPSKLISTELQMAGVV